MSRAGRAWIAGAAALAAAAAALAAGAGADPGHGPYITGEVSTRVRGKNAAYVNVRWDFKCLEDLLGDSTYSWTIKLIRLQPTPRRTRTIASGRSKRGAARVLLTPGRYDLVADPFSCRTERGAGSTAPELGFPFVVPDFCAWSVVELRGEASVKRGAARRALEAGDVVRPGNTVSTNGRAWVELASNGDDSALRVAAGSRLAVDRRHCGREGGWKLHLRSGSVRAELTSSAERSRRYEVRSPNATVQAHRAAWTVSLAAGRRPATGVTVHSGRVTVRGRTGRALVVRAGLATVISGSRAPTAPRRAQ